MKCFWKISILFLTIGLAITGCSNHDPLEITDKQIEALYYEIEPYADAILLSDNPDWSTLVEKYKDRKEIKKIDVQSCVFAIEFISGEKRGWVKSQPLITEDSKYGAAISSLEKEFFNQVILRSTSQNEKNPKIVLINTQYYESGREYNIDSSLVMRNIFNDKGWKVDLKDGEDANLNFFANSLTNYDAIYVNGHGYSSLDHNWLQAFKGNQSSISSNTMISRTNSLNTTNGIKEEIYINEDYFDEHYDKGSFPNSFIYLVNCQALKTPNKLAPIFVNKGAKVVVGWDEISICAHDYGAQYVGRLLLRNMLISGKTLETEFNNIDDKLKTNIYKNTPVHLVYFGRDDNNSSGFWKGGDYKLPTETTTIYVTGVSLNKTTTTMTIGGTEQLTETLSPNNATNKTVNWKSSNTNVATVSNTGLVTAMAAGSTTITVSTVDGNKTATCNVIVNNPATLKITSPEYGTIYHCGDWIDIFVDGYKGTDWQDYLELEYSCLVGEPKHTVNDEPNTYKNKAYPRKEDAYSFTFSPETPSVWDGHWVKLIAHNKKNNTWSEPQYVKISPSENKNGVLINGVRWATCNVDKPGTFAVKPEDAGMFYQWNRKIGWSATDPMKNSNGSTTWDNSTPTGTTWEKANDPSPTRYRVPTLEEIESILNTTYVTKEWTTLNGINGVKFTDKANGNSIFLPAAGYRSGKFSLNGRLYYVDSYGYYWSSTVNDNSLVCGLLFNLGSAVRVNDGRNEGLSVRPVAE